MLGLMNIVGEKVLRAAVSALGNRIRGPIEAQLTTIMMLKGLDFERDHGALVLACRTLASDRIQRTVLPEWLKRSGPTIKDITDEIRNDQRLDNDNKILLLATDLLERYGEAVLQAAVTAIKNSPPTSGG